jgi:hypothetical protein
MIFWHFGKPYRHVSRIARKGEKVVVLNKAKHGKDYEEGGIYTVIKSCENTVHFWDDAKEHNRMRHSEYIVLEEVHPSCHS